MRNIRLCCIIFLALTIAGLVYGPAAALPIVDPIHPKCPVMDSSEAGRVERIEYEILDRAGRCVPGPIMLIEGFPQSF